MRMELDLGLLALALRVKLLPHSTDILGLWARSSPPLKKTKEMHEYFKQSHFTLKSNYIVHIFKHKS